MGAKEDELARIRTAGPFDMPALRDVRNSLTALAVVLKRVAASDGWEGMSATAASERLEDLSRRYLEVDAIAARLESVVTDANRVRSRALEDAANLPSAQAPSWVHNTLEAFDFPGLPDPVDIAQGGLSIIENFLGGQREETAARMLDGYAAALESPRSETIAATTSLSALGDGSTALDDPDDGNVSAPGGPSGPRVGGVPYVPGGGLAPAGGSTATPPGNPGVGILVSVDDPGTGVLPTNPGGTGTISGGTGGTGGTVGTTLPGQIAGGGFGTAVTGASTAAALKLGAGSPIVAGGAARLGTGGLLGAGGAPGSTGMVGGAGAVNAAAGTRPGGMAVRGGGLLGGGSGAGSGSGGVAGAAGTGGGAGVGGTNAADKKRRAAGKGLGGPMAPKLDDDDYVRQVPGARAGERVASDDAPDAVDPDA